MGLSTAAPSTAPPAAGLEDFEPLLAGFRAKLDRALGDWLTAKRAEAVATGSPETMELIEGVGQLAGNGGKRLRPALVYYAYRACGGGADEEVLPLALSTELLHTY